jgi:hypothetical protein
MRPGSLLRRRPSPAIVISVIALFLSLGGVGYAAVSLPRNSVGNAQLRNGSVSFRKIRPGAVGIVRANTHQLQARVGATCSAGSAIGAIDQLGRVTCNSSLPSEVGTTSNTSTLGSTAATVTSVTLPAGSLYLALANPTATVTSGTTAQQVDVNCTLTVGSNTSARTMTLHTDGNSSDTTTQSVPMQLTGPAGTGSVSCQSSVPGGGTAPTVTVTAALSAIRIAG